MYPECPNVLDISINHFFSKYFCCKKLKSHTQNKKILCKLGVILIFLNQLNQTFQMIGGQKRELQSSWIVRMDVS